MNFVRRFPGHVGPAGTQARAFWIFSVCAAALVVIAASIAGGIARNRALAGLEEQARTDATLSASLVRAVLERQRALPLILADDRDLRDTLSDRDAAGIVSLNHKLEKLAEETRAAVIYVVGLDGIAIAASNWREPTSFVGNDYRFREYFQKGLQTGAAEHFALGSVSKKPGTYISRRVDGPGGPLGVVVAKVEFDEVEADWRASGKVISVVDDRRIVLITSQPSWRFMTIGEVASDQVRSIRESLQFGDAPLKPLPLRAQAQLDSHADLVGAVMPGDAGEKDFLEIRTPLATTSWELRQLVPLAPAIPAAVRQGRTNAALLATPFAALGILALWRRQRIAQRRAAEEAARAELERRVAERTHDLSLARDRLSAEIADHQTTERALRDVQHSLVQANRLAILGQVAAGVAHEINQPVATIRAYADNARTFLDRGRVEEAGTNLVSIAGLTERIGSITEELKAFSRKGRGAAEPTSMREVVEGALMLLRSRFSGRMEALNVTLPANDLMVVGNRIRLEQVLINLLQNALEAAAIRGEAGAVSVSVAETDGAVVLTVSDNGAGIPPSIRDALFTPFNTSKEGGLGLGLLISKDIVTDYGGRIEVSSDEAGTSFTVYLMQAEIP